VQRRLAMPLVGVRRPAGERRGLAEPCQLALGVREQPDIGASRKYTGVNCEVVALSCCVVRFECG
jgi:hypothetical protein